MSLRRRCARRVTAAIVAIGALALPASSSAQAVLETFEAAPASWQIATETAAGGSVQRSTARKFSGEASARLVTAAAGARAAIRSDFSDAAAAHVWQERPGTYRWQRARVFLPSATIAAAASGALTVARFWASGDANSTWALRVGQGGALSVAGRHHDTGALVQFPVYATWPADQWVELEIGLHSQAGPGVKRAFAFVLNGQFHGWYHQGRMQNEVYDRSAIGLVDVAVATPLDAFVDDWGVAGTTAFPTGTDARSTAAVQEQDYRTQNGAHWQIDWSTWGNELRMDPVHGLYSNTTRLQSGRNIDRMPVLDSGWAEIEIGWPKGTPPTQPTGYFGPMVGFRKEINREQNLEIIPIGTGGGNVDLVLEAWNERELILARWTMPVASIGGTRIPEAGDVIRARWEEVNATTLAVRASYYDASAARWHVDVINTTVPFTNLHGVNFDDGFHRASSITTDSPFYGIRRFRLGTLATEPGTAPCAYALKPTAVSVAGTGGAANIALATTAACAWTAVSHADWLSITSAASGTGSATVAVAAAANPTASPRSGTVTIAGQTVTVSQGPAAVPVVSVGDVVVAEGDVTVLATFPIRLSKASAQTATVQYATFDGSAVAGSDYAATSGTVTFPPGAISRTVTVSVLADAAIEATESFELRLSAPSQATVGDGIGVATIMPPGTTVAQPPVDLEVASILGRAVTVRWAAPLDGPAPTGFVLAGGAAPGESLATLALEASHRLLTVSLPPGRFFIRLHAQVGSAISLASNEVTVPVLQPVAPSAPVGLLGAADGSAVNLAWRRTYDGGAPDAAILDVSGALALSVPLPSGEAFAFPQVPPGQYTFAVRAANPHGIGATSNPVTLTFPAPCSGPPEPPDAVRVHRAGRSLVVSWLPPASGPAPTGYQLIVSGAFTGAFPLTSRSIGGAVGPGEYGFAVTGVNTCGQSAATPLQAVTVP